MKKALLFCMLAVLGILVGAAKTVYFERPSGVTQSTTINVYTWSENPEVHYNGSWPGSAIAGTTETIDGKSYIKEVINDATEKLIFNWNGGQTSNLKAADNAVYNKETRIGTIVDNHFVAYEEPKIRYYFYNADNWDKVYIHTWDPSPWNLGWPGKQLTDTETLADGKEYYYAEVYESSALQNMIFNNGGNGKQTGDIKGNNVVPFGIYNPSGYTNTTTKDLVPAVGNEVYFYNDLEWRTVYAYAWSGEGDNVTLYNGAWPGEAVTTTAVINEKEVLVVDFEGAKNIIFSCFDETHSHAEVYDWEKTRDLDYVPGTMYIASTAAIDIMPEKLYVIGGGTGWNINADDVDLTLDSPDSHIFTGDVKVTGEEFRIYSNLGDWNTGSLGNGDPNNRCTNITFTKGSYTTKAYRNNQGNWKLPMGYKDKVVKFTFNYVDKTFTIYDPSMITVKEMVAGVDNAVAPAEGDYANADAFKAAGDNDGLATVTITLEPGVHVNRACESPAVLFNDGHKVFEVSAIADPKDILDRNKIGIRAVSGNSFDGGTDDPTVFQVVFSTVTDDVLVFQGENELRFPDGFFMLGGNREILSVEVEGEEGTEEVAYENWTGGTPILGGSFVWNVAEAARPAVTPIEFVADGEDLVETHETGFTLSINKYGSHEYYAHVTVKEAGADEAVKDMKSGKGSSSIAVTGLKSGRMHEVTYHFHAFNDAESIEKENWVRDHNAVACEGTLDALTHPTAAVTLDTADETEEEGVINYACTMKLGAGQGVTILYAFDDSMTSGLTDDEIAAIMSEENPEGPASVRAREAVVAKAGVNKYEVSEADPTVALSYATADEVKNVATMAVYPKGDGTYVATPVNAKEVQDNTTMIQEVVTDDAAAEFYNMLGQRVENPSAGIYIMVKAGKAQKVAVK